MSDTCTVTISGGGQPITTELAKNDARMLGELADLLSKAPRRTPGAELPAEEIAARGERHEKSLQNATTVLAQLSELAKLDQNEMGLVLTYVQLIRFGDRALCVEENWILEVINELLDRCVFSGIGAALAEGPIVTLRTLVNSYGGFQGSIENARDAAKAYPQLFRDSAAEAAGVDATASAVEKAFESSGALSKAIRRAARKVAKERDARGRSAKGSRRRAAK